MGPGEDSGMLSSIMNPPIFHADQDLLIWRKKVASRVDFVTTSASNGPDKTFKSIAATLALHLYERGLPDAQKSIVDEAQALQKINHKQDDQVKAVQEIVDIVAVDPHIAVVTCLIDSFNKVTNCKKRPNENLNTFASRYRGLAAEHLMRVGATTSSQVGEVLAINLLQNANLPESTLTNAKVSLIQLAEARKEKECQEPFSISPRNVKAILTTVKELKELEETLDKDASSQGDGPIDVLISILPVIASANKTLKDPSDEMEKAVELPKCKSQERRSHKVYHINWREMRVIVG